VIDNGDGKAIASLLNAYPEMVRQFLRQSEETLGIPLTANLPPALQAKVNPTASQEES